MAPELYSVVAVLVLLFEIRSPFRMAELELLVAILMQPLQSLSVYIVCLSDTFVTTPTLGSSNAKISPQGFLTDC